MTFETFLQCLIKIGESLYGNNLSPSQALQKLVRVFMLPLHAKISSSQQMMVGQQGGAFELQYDELVALVVKDVGHVLY